MGVTTQAGAVLRKTATLPHIKKSPNGAFLVVLKG